MERTLKLKFTLTLSMMCLSVGLFGYRIVHPTSSVAAIDCYDYGVGAAQNALFFYGCSDGGGTAWGYVQFDCESSCPNDEQGDLQACYDGALAECQAESCCT